MGGLVPTALFMELERSVVSRVGCGVYRRYFNVFGGERLDEHFKISFLGFLMVGGSLKLENRYDVKITAILAAYPLVNISMCRKHGGRP